MPMCPKCGSKSVRTSYITDCTSTIGKIGAKIIFGTLSLPFGGHAANTVGYAAGKTGGKIGQALWDKLVCEKCGNTWENPKSIWED